MVSSWNSKETEGKKEKIDKKKQKKNAETKSNVMITTLAQKEREKEIWRNTGPKPRQEEEVELVVDAVLRGVGALEWMKEVSPTGGGVKVGNESEILKERWPEPERNKTYFA